MERSEFYEKIRDEIKDYLPKKYEDTEISLDSRLSVNGEEIVSLLVRDSSLNMAPSIRLAPFFEEFQDGASFDGIMGRISHACVQAMPLKSVGVNEITDFDKALPNINLKLISYEKNKEFLEDKPYTMVDDLAAIYYVKLDGKGFGVDGLQGSVVIRKHMLENYGITESELHELAVRNMEKEPMSLKNMRDVLIEMMYPSGIPNELEDSMAFMLPPDVMPMYVLTNESKINGACQLASTKNMDIAAEKLGGDFYVIPSSIHECILIPYADGLEPSSLTSMIGEVNDSCVENAEVLSDHVYGYDAVAHELVAGDVLQSRISQRSMEVSKETTVEKSAKTSVLDKLSQKQTEVSNKVTEKTEKHISKDDLSQ